MSVDPAGKSPIELDAQYRALREEAGWVERSCDFLEVTGPDASEYLQSQLTNDVEAGNCIYAALLDRKAHVMADCRVLRLADDRFLLASSPEAIAYLKKHLDTYRIGHDVSVSSADGLLMVSVLGPAARSLLDCPAAGSADEFARVGLDAKEYLAAGTHDGIDLICSRDQLDGLRKSLDSRGIVEVEESAAEIVRIEAGEPRFGMELGPEVMPAEAGIVDRAVDFEKGCYLGQEPVARLHYKGRPNRLLRGLLLSRTARVGEELHFGERRVGLVTSCGISPAHGPIALSVLRREAEPGSTVTLGDDDASASVVELPFHAR